MKYFAYLDKPTANYSTKELLKFWALGTLKCLESDIKSLSKKLFPDYNGKYDFYLVWENPEDSLKHHIRINLRVAKSQSKKPFLMNFEHFRLEDCDVFLLMSIYCDCPKYWVIGANAIHENKNFTPQHRNQATAEKASDYSKADIYEGQIMMTNQNVNDFADYLATERTIKTKIIEQYKIQKGL